jgi:hypothetical protein
MSRFAAFAVTLALATAAVPALAEPRHDPAGQHGEAEAKKFPMPASAFRDHVRARTEKRRARMEEHIAKQRLTKDQADARRAHFQAAVARLNAKVDEVCADGTVTHDEARQVRALSRELFHHGQHGHTPARRR